MAGLRTYQRRASSRGAGTGHQVACSVRRLYSGNDVIKVKAIQGVKLRPGVLSDTNKLVPCNKLPVTSIEDNIKITTTRFTRSNVVATTKQDKSLSTISSYTHYKRQPINQTTIITKTFTQANPAKVTQSVTSKNGIITLTQTMPVSAKQNDRVSENINFTREKSKSPQIVKVSPIDVNMINLNCGISLRDLDSTDFIDSALSKSSLYDNSAITMAVPDKPLNLPTTIIENQNSIMMQPQQSLASSPQVKLLSLINITSPPSPLDKSLTPSVSPGNECQRTSRSSPMPASDDLTSLSWLHSLDMVRMVPHLSTPPTPPASPPLSTLHDTDNKRHHNHNNNHSKVEEEPKPDPIDYSKDGSVKPPFSYAALIGMAMRENNNKMTLSAIYSWIKEHYVFYQTADPSWQNSIRHNLSLNKSFLKMPRSKDEPGKGGFWCLDPDYAETRPDGTFKRKRPHKPTSPPTSKVKKSKPPLMIPTLNNAHKCATTPPEAMEQPTTQFALTSSDGFNTVCSTTVEALGPMDGSKIVIHHPMPYLPPPPPQPLKDNNVYFGTEEITERTLSLEEVTSDTLRDNFSWNSLLGDTSAPAAEEEAWGLCRTQELVTDLTHSGDPSTYLTTPATTTPGIMHTNEYHSYSTDQQLQPLPTIDNIHQTASRHSNSQVVFQSLDLSPDDSNKLDEEFFASPEYSDASNDDGDQLASLEIHHSLHSVPTTHSWTAYTNDSHAALLDPNAGIQHVPNTAEDNLKLHTHHQDVQRYTQHQDPQQMMSLPSMSTFTSRGPLDDAHNLTPLEPVTTSVIVQDAHAHCWGDDYPWDESRTLSMFDPTLDFDRLIDLDNL